MGREANRTVGASMPTEDMLWESVARGIRLVNYDALPRQLFSAWVSKFHRSDLSEEADALEHVMHMEFAVQLPWKERDQRRRHLLRTTWAPHHTLAEWRNVRVEPQLPKLMKLKGCSLDDDIVDLAERGFLAAARYCLPSSLLPRHQGSRQELHMEVARELLEWLRGPRAQAVMMLQYVCNTSAAVLLPLHAMGLLGSCDEGPQSSFPVSVHMLWFAFMLLSVLSSLGIICCVCGADGREFLRRSILRVFIRFFAMCLMLSDTYQDVVFLAIAKSCHYDLWRMSAWLILAGIGIFQIGIQCVMLLRCYRKHRRAKNPEERERMSVEGIYQMLRGADNLLLGYVIQPAVQERLGGASSWATKTAEARIAMLRVMFQDVEQAALQTVFLVFFEDVSGADKTWISLSVVTSLVISYSLTVHSLPEARDWMWHRLLANMPGSRRFRSFRTVWLVVLVSLSRAALAWPWMASCSGAGEECVEEAALCFGIWCCTEGRRTLLGLPAHEETFGQVCWWSALSSAGLLLALGAVALVTWVRKRFRARERLRISKNEQYNPDRLREVSGQNLLRPRVDADDDQWVNLGRWLVGSQPKTKHIFERGDHNAFLLSRARPLAHTKAVRKAEKLMPSIILDIRQHSLSGERSFELVSSVSRYCGFMERTRRLAVVRKRVAELLSMRSFLQASIREKSAQILEATNGFAPLRLVHWRVLKDLGELPRAGGKSGAEEVEDLLHKIAKQMPSGSTSNDAADRLVPFFLSHRWLRCQGPRSVHHPDSLDNIKARQLVAFAEWFMACNRAAGFKCEVAFWIDWSCADQDNPDIIEMHSAALPLFVSACSKVISWQTPDFERRCWLMVERLLAYCFCPGGLKPFVINETSFIVEKRIEDSRRNSRRGSDSADAGPEDSTGETTICRSVWQVWLDGDWVDFDSATQSKFNEAKASGQDKVKLTIFGSDGTGREYEMDMQKMTQRNVKSKVIRNIRCDMTESVLDPTASAQMGDEAIAPLVPTVLGKGSSSRSLTFLMGRRASSSMDGANLQFRARKLSDPLDFESHRVTAASDRRAIAQLVEVTLAVPALEVFADRQPVEFGLTEVVEQSLVNNIELGNQWQGRTAPPGSWLMPAHSDKSDWRIVVWKGDESAGAGARDSLLEHADAMVWMDFGYQIPPREAPPTQDQLNDMFEAVDREFAKGNQEELVRRSKALIIGLMQDLRCAMNSDEERDILESIERCRDVHLPDKDEAYELLSRRRLKQALDADDEPTLRFVVDTASNWGCEHLQEFKDARARQKELTKMALESRLAEQLVTAVRERDLPVFIAVHQISEAKCLADLVQQVCIEADKWVQALARDNKNPDLQELHTAAAEGGWSYLAMRALGAIEEPKLQKRLNDPSTRDNLAALRALEKQAKDLHLQDLAEKAKSMAKQAAEAINNKMGLPPEWDVVQEQHGQRSKLLLKTEELDARLLGRIQEMVNGTFRGWGAEKRPRTRDRPPGQLVAIWLEVKSVVYVQNAEYYLNYRDRQNKILGKMRENQPRYDVKTSCASLAGVGRHARNPLNRDCNEVYLWHGTSPEGARGITDTEFDLRRAGKATGKLFGPGIYLAESCLKADEYTKPDHRGLYPLVLCRTTLGNVNYCADEYPQAGALEASCRSGKYHSILGDRQVVHGTFREFIVYDKHQVYPEYIVWYARRWFNDGAGDAAA
jgi:hypothetical protein